MTYRRASIRWPNVRIQATWSRRQWLFVDSRIQTTVSRRFSKPRKKGTDPFNTHNAADGARFSPIRF
jgi:hypothetical protein